MDSLSPTLTVLEIDKRDCPPEQLESELTRSLEQCSGEALLWTAKRPKKNWFRFVDHWQALVFSSNVSFEQILWLRTESLPKLGSEQESEFHSLLQGYKGLFTDKESSSGDYAEQVRSHIRKQEQEFFPLFLKSLNAHRALRELGYEHRGLEAGLSRLPGIVESWRRGELSAKTRERFDLDFFHLLEHHVERERDAIYPAAVFLNRG